MSYLVLARKSRPQTFAEVVGQRPVVKTLQNSLARKRVAHAILFSGVRGVGKTTLARLMAKAINCTGETETPPCNTCPSCREITLGNALDLYEIDGASNRGIQEIRDLKDKLRFLPTSSRYKIIIIDEVHMLTTEAFNALLKTLEEPPAHVYFMFATTELHKIPITILSRCQQYELKRVPAAELSTHFQRLALLEGFEIEPPALALIVREAEGSVRDGLSLLDQIFSFGEKQIRTEDVVEVLGLVDREVLMRLTAGLLDGDRAAALLALDEIFAFGMDIRRFTADLMGCFRNLILTRIEGCNSLLDLPEQEIALFKEIAFRYSLETLHMKLNLLMEAVEEIRYSAQPRLALETAFLKIIESGNVIPVATLLGHLEEMLQKCRNDTPPTASPLPSQGTQPPASIQEQPQPLGQLYSPPDVSGNAVVQAPQAGKVSAPPTSITAVPEKAATSTLPESSPAPSAPPTAAKNIEIHPHERDIRRDWPDFVKYVQGQKIWMAQDLQRADSVKQTDQELHLRYSDPVNCALLRQGENRQFLNEYFLDFFQKNLKIRFIIPDQQDAAETPGADTPQSKRQQLASDPLVIMAAEVFNGQVGDIRVGQQSR